MTDTPPPQAVDYAGTPLNIGDRVAVILVIFDTSPALYTGRIVLINTDQVCVDTGSLHVIRGQKWRPTGKPESMRYETLISNPNVAPKDGA